MFDKLQEIENQYNSLQEQLYDQSNASDSEKIMKINKKLTELEAIYNLYQEYKKRISYYNEGKETLENEEDEEFKEIAKNQMEEAEQKLEDLQKQLKIEMLPKDPNDDKNIFLEIRAAAGGDEAGLFGMELMRMYLRYAERHNLNYEIIEENHSEIGGIKLAIIKIKGEKVYSKLKFESGVHRVQRVPETESGGRVHTSTVTVSVMPEVEDVQVNLSQNDVEMETFGASSAGGQNANKSESGVRLHHTKSGIVVTISDTKSQLKNKEKAYSVLRAKLYQMEADKQKQEQQEEKLDQIGGGDRSEKIRTYNFPQDRVTDHRIKKSWSNIPKIMDGFIDEIIDSLIIENQTKLLEKVEEKI